MIFNVTDFAALLLLCVTWPLGGSIGQSMETVKRQDNCASCDKCSFFAEDKERKLARVDVLLQCAV